MINANTCLQRAMRSFSIYKIYEASVEVFIGEMYLRLYFIFTQLKATLRAGWKKGAELGGERSEKGEAIFLGRCLKNLGVLPWLMTKYREDAGLNGTNLECWFHLHHLFNPCGSWFPLLNIAHSRMMHSTLLGGHEE